MRRRYGISTHASAYKAQPRTELVGLCDVGAGPLRDAVRRYPGARAYRDVDALLDAEQPDLISVCVPPFAHESVVRRCIARSVRLIFCEKPFTASSAAARRLIRAARAAGTSILVNYWRRFDSGHQRVADLVRTRAVGRVQLARVVYGNGLLNMASHLINLFLDVLGPADWVEAAQGVNDRPGDPSPHVAIGFRGGSRAVFSPCSFRHYRIFELDILGTAGRVTVTNEGLELRHYAVKENEDVSGAYQLDLPGAIIRSTVAAAMTAGVDRAVRILDSGTKTWPDHAVDTHEVIEAAKASLARGRRIRLRGRS
jgi:predicted dehydrogenase